MNLVQAFLEVKSGKAVDVRPHGNSMEPRIRSGQLVHIEPLNGTSAEIGDAVLCKVNGHVYLHLVKAKGKDGAYLIGNNKGRINGWSRQVVGRVTSVSD